MSCSAPERAEPSGRAECPRILCVDDEPFVLDALRDVLRRHFDVRIARDGASALELLAAQPDDYPVVISDMRMPGMTGACFLARATRVAPSAVPILLTGQAEVGAAIEALNHGRLFRLLTKPCTREALVAACAAALEQNRLMRAERTLLEATLPAVVGVLADILSIASPTAFGRTERIREEAQRMAAAAGCEGAWEIELGAMLAQVGAVTLPPGTADKLYAGARLTRREQALVDRAPALAQRLLAGIPRLDGVREIVARQRSRFDDDDALPLGARILKIVCDFDDLIARRVDPDVALDALERRRGSYDPALLRTFTERKRVSAQPQRTAAVALRSLGPGMRLVDDVRDVDGALLAARGSVATEALLERLSNLRTGSVREPIRVER